MQTPVVTTTRNPCTIGAKSLFKLLNDKSPVGAPAREFFERTRSSVQCKNVIPVKSSCWICGGAIDPSLKYPNLYAAECEHVLPVAQGVIFLQLYDSRFKGNITEAIKLEYEWAHSICNNRKSSLVLIKGSEAGFEPDLDKIKILLTDLKTYLPFIDVESQSDSMQRRLFRVTDFINKSPDFEINTSGFMCLGQDVKKRLQFSAGRRKTFKRKNNGVSRRTYKHSNRKASFSHRKRRASN